MRKEPAVSGLRLEDYLCLLAAAVAAGSVFLPWFQIEITTAFEGNARHTPYGTFSGTFVEGGWAGLSLSLFGLVMLFLRIKWSGVPTFCNVLLGLGYLVGWIDLSEKIVANYSGNALVQIEPQAGLYMFVASSLFCSMLTLRIHYASRGF